MRCTSGSSANPASRLSTAATTRSGDRSRRQARSRPSRAGEQPEPVWFVFEHDYCKGRLEADCQQWTAAEWRRDQGLEARDELEVGFRELVSHPWFIGGRRLQAEELERIAASIRSAAID